MNFLGSYCIGLIVGAFVSWLWSRVYYTRRNTHIQVGGDNSTQTQTIIIRHNMAEEGDIKDIKLLKKSTNEDDDGTYSE